MATTSGNYPLREQEYNKFEKMQTKEEFSKTVNDNSNKEDKATEKQVGGAWYKKYNIQPIEFVLENEDVLHPTDALMANNVLKYCLRHREKNGKEDLEKAIHYIELIKEHTYEKD